MRPDLAEAERRARAGAAALQAGNGAEARSNLEPLVAAGQANLQVWLLLALACRMDGDRAAEERAVDGALGLDAKNLRALVLKGDCRLAAGDRRAAASYYGTAVKLAAQHGTLPGDLGSEVARAQAAMDDLAAAFRGQLETRLAEQGLEPARRSRRFEESLAILAGEKQIYLQQPSAYYFPGLPQIQFYEPADFPWAAEVEAEAGAIREELEALLAEPGLFSPYLKARENRPSYDFHGLLDNPEWSTLYLYENGARAEPVASRCPRTFAALERAPLPYITTRAPSILFSLLKGGARIAPHHGMINTRLICHLPLVVPDGCGFRVGSEVRSWEPGKLLIFDDTIEHEAWNDGGGDRVILIFDVWRPELDAEERRAVAAMFEAIDGPAAA